MFFLCSNYFLLLLLMLMYPSSKKNLLSISFCFASIFSWFPQTPNTASCSVRFERKGFTAFYFFYALIMSTTQSERKSSGKNNLQNTGDNASGCN